jgi:hypothetical protein
MIFSKMFLTSFKTVTRKLTPSLGFNVIRSMATEVFLGNLPQTLTEDELRKILEEKIGQRLNVLFLKLMLT